MIRDSSSALIQMLARRGFSVSGTSRPVPPLLPQDPARLDSWYAALGRYSFRLFLRDVLKRRELFTAGQVARYVDGETCSRYIAFLVGLGLAAPCPGGFRLLSDPGQSFGPTLEWYTSELLAREFGMDSLWGVRFKKSRAAGDFDVLAGFDGKLLCVETKSSPPAQVEQPEIRGFLERIDELRPDIALFLDDTGFRMGDKIVPMFERELGETGAGSAGLERIGGERFRLGHRLFVMNARPGIPFNIREALGIHHRESSGRPW